MITQKSADIKFSIKVFQKAIYSLNLYYMPLFKLIYIYCKLN